MTDDEVRACVHSRMCIHVISAILLAAPEAPLCLLSPGFAGASEKIPQPPSARLYEQADDGGQLDRPRDHHLTDARNRGEFWQRAAAKDPAEDEHPFSVVSGG
jgi:hypothetical protein